MKYSLVLRRNVEGQDSGEGVSTSPSAFPKDLIAEAADRLGWLGLLYAAGFSLVYFTPRLLVGAGVVELLTRTHSVIALVSIALGLAVFLLSRHATMAPQHILNLGLVFEVVGALGIAMSEFWGQFPAYDPEGMLADFLGIPWECVWIIGFPLLAPARPSKTLIASLAAASAGPATVGLSVLAGPGMPNVPLYFFVGYFLFTTYLCAGIAYLISRGVLKYGVRLRRARDIGNYHLIERLGEGGMGEVWAATHRMLARPAAVKLIRPELLGHNDSSRDTVLKRFEREAKATAALTSCHTIAIYDFGYTEDGAFFYVMELLCGLNLETLVRRFGPIRPARAVHFLRQACESLGEAHERGLVHRDVKPANIFACKLGHDCDFVKVLDFGLVKTTEQREPRHQLTGEGIAAGTPAYMAPEMALGTPTVDGRADIYSVGCVAYWLLTGQQVFRGKSQIATVVDHVKTPPVPPSQRTEVDIPEALERVIMACLEKDPENRPQTAEQLSDLLAESVPDDAWSTKRAAEWWRLHLEGSGAGTMRITEGLSPQMVLRVLH
ncbi:MAG: serine/threonine protein kinase [Gemmatimonadota bacterium]|nr:MAG: serine/threonine protein kinase [Gemmatimonadota bacterium]